MSIGVTSEIDTTIARVEGPRRRLPSRPAEAHSQYTCRFLFSSAIGLPFQEDRESRVPLQTNSEKLMLPPQIRGLAGVVPEDGVADDISAHGRVVEKMAFRMESQPTADTRFTY